MISTTDRTTNAGGVPAAGQPVVDDVMTEIFASIRQFRCSGATRLTREGISIAHLHVLWLLDQHGDLPMSHVAELLGVSLSNATGLIDRMEERGLVERIRVPDDRRVVLVRITLHGTETIDSIEVLRRDTLRRLLARLDGRQLEVVREIVRELSAAIAESDEAGCPDAVITKPTERSAAQRSAAAAR